MPRVARGERLDGAPRRADEAGPEQQVLGRVAGDDELREEHEVGAGGARLVEPAGDPVRVAVEVADDGVHLCERESHSGLSSRFSPLGRKH